MCEGDDVAAWWNCWLSTLTPSLSQFPGRVSNATISVANVENCHHSTRLLAQVRPPSSCPSSCPSNKVIATIILQPRHHSIRMIISITDGSLCWWSSFALILLLFIARNSSFYHYHCHHYLHKLWLQDMVAKQWQKQGYWERLNPHIFAPQTSLRNILGTKNLHEILSDRESIALAMQVQVFFDILNGGDVFVLLYVYK